MPAATHCVDLRTQKGPGCTPSREDSSQTARSTKVAIGSSIGDNMTDDYTGVEGRITLVRGNGSTFQSHVHFVATRDHDVDLRLPSGQLIQVPLSAVRLFEPGNIDDFKEPSPTRTALSEPTAATSDSTAALPPASSDDGGPEALTVEDALRAVAAGARALHMAEGHPSTPSERQTRSVNGQLQALRLDLELLQTKVSNKAYSRALDSVVNVVDSAIDRTAADSLKEAKRIRNGYEESRRIARRILDRFTKSSTIVDGLKTSLGAVSTAELSDWERFTSRFEAKPRLVTQDHLMANLSPSGEFLLPFRVALDEGPETARGVKLVLDQHRGIEAVGNTPQIEKLQPGDTKIIRVRLQDRRRQGSRDEIKIQAHLQYLGPSNELLRSPRQKITVRLVRPASFQQIPNPFRDYASGVPVDDPAMFFGRSKVMDDIVHHLTVRPVGRCYALYGQKRSGKSSVVNQLQVQLAGSGALVARLSMGAVDRGAITQTFVAEVVDQLREQVAGMLDQKTFANLLTRWPEAGAIANQPLASLRKAVTAARALLKSAGHEEPPRVVIMVDEFTYLYELLRRTNVAESDQNQLRDFMRQWKSLLEAKIFSALVVGQDTMPSFIETFPNEFSVMHTERLDYLSDEETQELADLPIRRTDGSSRFSGYGLQAIHSYTSGHPFYTQILCDRVVELANDNRRDDISDVDVESAVSTLLAGSREIGMFRFDCLLSADNTGGLLDEMLSSAGMGGQEPASDRALHIVHRLALVSGEQNKPVMVEALDLSHEELRVFRDLCQRQVVMLRDGKAHVRILLFAEYLRRLDS